jgi:hypothetical protein
MNDRITEVAKELAEQSRFCCWELAKYLFTANTGAAAGLLFLLRSTPGNSFVLFSFCLFCFGTFCVLVSIFVGTTHAVEVAEGFQKDLLSGTIESQLASRHIERLNGRKTRIIPLGAWLSFGSLIAGGVIAAVALFKGAIPTNEQKTNPAINVVVTNAPTFSLTVTSALPVYVLEPATNAIHPH